nr:MAG TPA: hypothetical protein [Caudoviricetes sp.]
MIPQGRLTYNLPFSSQQFLQREGHTNRICPQYSQSYQCWGCGK